MDKGRPYDPRLFDRTCLCGRTFRQKYVGQGFCKQKCRWRALFEMADIPVTNLNRMIEEVRHGSR